MVPKKRKIAKTRNVEKGSGEKDEVIKAKESRDEEEKLKPAESLKSKIDDLVASNESKEKELQTFAGEKKVLSRMCNDLKKQLEDLRTENEIKKRKLENQFKIIQNNVHTYLNCNQKLKRENVEQNSEIAKQKSRIDELTALNEQKEEKIQTLIKERDNLNHLLAEQKAENLFSVKN